MFNKSIIIFIYLFQTILAFDIIDLVITGFKWNVNYLKNAPDYKYSAIIKPGDCKSVIVSRYSLTEVCSSGGSRLYFNPYDTVIRGCYTIGKATTKSFADCCQLNYNPVNGAAPGTIHYIEFCDGKRPKNGKNPAEMNKYGINRNINDIGLVDKSMDVYEHCKLKYNKSKCNNAKEAVKKLESKKSRLE
ncbi:hypothetical protein PIROE2DRAFT_56976 [Piromyces sp. E2]|nr:hypothetical protein PIROE2DRAFT_56976 [Piromyces sp. E2]|eukprot:OUM70086.1 hypothetical protein PIROE2DRAFT_56976 [Piromyces sp. E2]